MAKSLAGQVESIGRAQRRAQERTDELTQCGVEIQALLDACEATFRVIVQTEYINGTTRHTPVVQVVSK